MKSRHIGCVFLALFAAHAVFSSPTAPSDSSLALGNSMTLLPRDTGAAPQPSGLGSFASIAVLHDGRVKPLETLARHLLLQWSGRRSAAGRSALEILAEILFVPGRTGDLPLFRIDNPEVAEALRIEPDQHRRYSYRRLEPALHRLQSLAARADSVEAGKRNLVEKEMLRTFANVVAYLSLTHSLHFARPSSALAVQHPETRSLLELPADGKDAPTFWQLMEKAPTLARVLEEASTRPDAARGDLESEVIRLSRSMYLQSQSAQPSPFRVLPDPQNHEAWLSPSEVIADPVRLQTLHGEVGFLAALSDAYRRGDASGFASQADSLRAAIGKTAAARLEKTNFPLEILNHRVDPLFLAVAAYWIALFLAFLYFLTRRKRLYSAAWLVALAGLAVHVCGIAVRVLVMRRPPVTSLYETFPFVAAVSIAAALFLERRNRQGVALLAAALLGVILLSIANRYAADGDTMQMLVAVLNSNFWLSTHVLCITTGYAACMLSGAIGHIYLVRAAFPGRGDPRVAPTGDALKEIDRMVYGTLCFGLLFSFIGTVLGGIWADQSWGRFWGWDPKENGALLIVIWCAILLHARMFGKIRALGMAAGSVLGAVIVSLAWLGVNLLNVGLHSYGFTSGAALKLFGYIGGEILFLLAIGIWIRLRRKPALST